MHRDPAFGAGSEPGFAELVARGRAALATGDAAAAEAAFAQALRLAPGDRAVLEGLADAAAALGRADGEIWARRRIAEIAPGDPIAHAELGDALRRDDRNTEAAGAFFLARTRAPQDRQVRMLAWQTLPIVHPDRASFERARAAWDRELAAFEADLAERPPSPAEARALLVAATNFHRHYLGEPLFDAQRRYGALLGGLARRGYPDFAEVAPPPARARRRIGFVSAHLREHTVAKLFGRWITGLDPRRFERCAFALDAREDAWTAQLRGAIEHFVAAPAHVDAAAAAIRAAQLDVLVHLDVGMHPWSQALAALRLAPRQLVAWGHPVTTGLDTIDAFVSGAAMEPPDATSHYTETLVALPNLGIDYAAPPPASAHAPPLPPGYLFCAQSAHKLHPGHDDAFAEACARTGLPLALVPHPKAHVREALVRRLGKAFAANGLDPARAIVALPMLAHDGFLALARGAAVVLDSFDWSGGNTTLEALAQGAPVVTLPGATMRTRHSAAMLGLAGLDELVAPDLGGWLERVVAIARDPDRRAAYARTIPGRARALFDDPAVVPALEALLAG